MAALIALAAVLAAGGSVCGDSPVVTILADFEDDSVAASLVDLQNVLPTDCTVRRTPVPARGQRCLALDLGATATNVSVACDLRLRQPVRFHQADRIAAFCWLKKGEFQLVFRIRDARGQVFETALQTVRTRNRWIRVGVGLQPQRLRRVRGDGRLAWPIQVHGFRVASNRLGRQTLFLDDLQVEHQVERRETIRGEFIFDQPTRIYRPGSTIGAKIQLENRSREHPLRLSVELAWTRPDGSVLDTQRAGVTLPASGRDFRSRQPVDFSQRIAQPGLYRLVARARASTWTRPNVFETTIGVTPSNRLLPRGRSTFFGVWADLLREPAADQRLEIDVARDIGVQLLAIETSWRTIEPTAGHVDLAALDPIIDALVASEIAPLIVLTDPPGWAPPGQGRLTRLTTLLTRLVQHYGPRVSRYLLSADVLPAGTGAGRYLAGTETGHYLADSSAAAASTLQELQEHVTRARPGIHVIAPPLRLSRGPAAISRPARGPAAALGGGEVGRLLAELSEATPELQWSFRTAGESAGALQTLRQFQNSAGITWQSSHWWLHDARPLVGQTFFADAEAVLRHYVHAARAGVAGLIWYDLRDRDNDPARPETMRGLVRRDFSPKANLLGYASAAGMLTGLACRGPVLGAPPEFESALFIGSDRQVAVLLPKPNRIYPAVLAPVQGVPGKFEIRDFERRRSRVLSATTPPLVATLPRPLFVTLVVASSQPEAQIAFAQPWLDAPATVFCGAEEPFTITLDGMANVRRGSVRLKLPDEAPYTARPLRESFGGDGRETLSFPFRLSTKPQQALERSTLTIKVSVDGRTTQVPIEVRPLAEIARRTARSAKLITEEYRLGDLTPAEEQRASAGGTVFAAYEAARLHLAILLEDDHFVPTALAADNTATGDELLIGVAVENADTHAEARVDTAARTPVLRPVHGTPAERLSGWRCTLTPRSDPDTRIYQISISGQGLGVERLEPPLRLLLGVRYVDDDGDAAPAQALHWGRGLDGRRSTHGFRWARLKKPADR